MRAEPVRDPGGRIGTAGGGEDEAPLAPARALRVGGGGEQKPVRLRLVAAGEEVLKGLREEYEREGDGEAEGNESRLDEAAAALGHPGEEEDARDGEEREPGQALPEVAAADVRELVRRDREDLALGEAAVEHRVVEDDALRRPDARDVGVGGRRPPARGGGEEPVHPDTFGTGQPP